MDFMEKIADLRAHIFHMVLVPLPHGSRQPNTAPGCRHKGGRVLFSTGQAHDLIDQMCIRDSAFGLM